MTSEIEKKLAGEAAVDLVKDGMVIGLGTGSTVRYFIEGIGKKVAEGLKVIGIPTSVQTEKIARKAGIEITTLQEHSKLDLTVDGADEVDSELNLIKGMGGALFREKIVAKAAKRFVVVVDSSKLVRLLGEKTPVPVEVHIFGWKATSDWLRSKGCLPALRKSGQNPYLTDNGNFIIDCHFGAIPDPAGLESQLNNVPGAVENGIFTGIVDHVIVAKGDSVGRITGLKRDSSVS